MAANYTIQGQQRDIQILGPSQVQDVMRLTATTIPSGIWFERFVSVAAWKSEGSGPLVEPLAAGIERVMTFQDVAGMAAVEDTDASGLVVPMFEITVVTTTADPNQVGPMTAVVKVPSRWLLSDALIDSDIVPLLAAAVITLVQTAAL